MTILLLALVVLGGVGIPEAIPVDADQIQSGHFYNIDTEIRVEGKIVKIFFESRYAQKDSFLLLSIKDAYDQKHYTVEISPSWFFDYDLHKGEKIKVLGSHYTREEIHFILAREIQIGSEKIAVRDKKGFPYWREAKMMKRMKKRHQG